MTIEALVEKGLIKNTKTDIKLLGEGEISKKLTVRVHAISASAREKIEAAGGTVELLREKKVKKMRHHKAAAPATADEAPEETTEATEAPAEEE